MGSLHTFGCSITQGFALPDVVKTLCNDQGQPLTNKQVEDSGIHWSEIHLYQPSRYAWPQQLADRLALPVYNYARRGACFQQIARQCAVEAENIRPEDTVIVMWTYLSRLSLQWPTRTSVPFANIAEPTRGWRTMILGFNNFFGLRPSKHSTDSTELNIQQYIHDSTQYTYLDPLGIYNRYYNNLTLQQMTAGFLDNTGARVIHLSVEPESALDQLELARQDLDPSLKEYEEIPHPNTWYKIAVDHDSCRVILDPTIPLAENDMHPSMEHHRRFADHIYDRYFAGSDS